jgi:hypothetical protein
MRRVPRKRGRPKRGRLASRLRLAHHCCPLTDQSPEAASTDTPAVAGPDFADSSRFHSGPFQRQPVNLSTGPRLHACRAVAWQRRVHSVPPPQIAEDRQAPCRERESFRQVPTAGMPRIGVLPKLPPAQGPQNKSDLCRAGQGAGLTPALMPIGRPAPYQPTAPRLTRPSEVSAARARQGDADFVHVVLLSFQGDKIHAKLTGLGLQ